MIYTAIEIDKFAVKVSDDNHEGIVRYYDVREVSGKMLGKVDFFCGGSPCQGFSFSGKQLAFDDPRSVLFFEYVRLLKELLDINPDMQWMLENVQMKKEFEGIITETLWGTKPIKVNSAIFSPQNRVRNYWCSWHINPLLFVDRERYLHHVLEIDSGEEIKTYTPRDQESISNNCRQVGMADTINGHDYLKRVYSQNAKAPTLTTMGGGNTEPKVALTEPQWNAASIRNRRLDENGVRKDDQMELDLVPCLEVKGQNKSNALTTVQKDNLASTLPQGRYPIADIVGGQGKDLLRADIQKSSTLLARDYKGFGNQGMTGVRVPKIKQYPRGKNKGGIKGQDGKTPTMTSNSWQNNNHLTYDGGYTWRRLSVVECSRLQGLPDDYCKSVSKSQGYKQLGNGFQVDTIFELLKQLPKDTPLDNVASAFDGISCLKVALDQYKGWRGEET
jgi:DNA-cytosine methyltransferase